MILAAFDIGAGDEVLVPSMSFVATAAAVVHAGATPVFVDIEAADRPHLSLDEARRLITPRTRAIMVMHYGGFAVDLPAWRRLADEHGLLLFEDAAHVAGLAGATGTGSDAAAFSFFTNKNMTTAEGGMVVVADEARRERVRLLRSHGMTASTLDRDRGRAVGYDVVECGYNFRMDELRAALGLVQIERLPTWNRTRVELLARYRELLDERVARGVRALRPPPPDLGPYHADRCCRERCDRTAIMASMRAAEVQTSVHYPAIHQFTYYRHRFGDVRLPHTEAFSRRELTLPLHPALSSADVERVVEALATAVAVSGEPAPIDERTSHVDFSGRTVLVVGGAGYVGSVLVTELLRAGAEVRVLDQLIYDNGFALAHLLDDPHLRFQRGDLRSRDDLAEAAPGATDLVLLASLVGDPICKAYPELAREINENGAKRVVDHLDDMGIRRFVFTSTCSNYGIHESSRLATEESDAQPAVALRPHQDRGREARARPGERAGVRHHRAADRHRVRALPPHAVRPHRFPIRVGIGDRAAVAGLRRRHLASLLPRARHLQGRS